MLRWNRYNGCKKSQEIGTHIMLLILKRISAEGNEDL